MDQTEDIVAVGWARGEPTTAGEWGDEEGSLLDTMVLLRGDVATSRDNLKNQADNGFLRLIVLARKTLGKVKFVRLSRGLDCIVPLVSTQLALYV